MENLDPSMQNDELTERERINNPSTRLSCIRNGVHDILCHLNVPVMSRSDVDTVGILEDELTSMSVDDQGKCTAQDSGKRCV